MCNHSRSHGNWISLRQVNSSNRLLGLTFAAIVLSRTPLPPPPPPPPPELLWSSSSPPRTPTPVVLQFSSSSSSSSPSPPVLLLQFSFSSSSPSPPVLLLLQSSSSPPPVILQSSSSPPPLPPVLLLFLQSSSSSSPPPLPPVLLQVLLPQNFSSCSSSFCKGVWGAWGKAQGRGAENLRGSQCDVLFVAENIYRGWALAAHQTSALRRLSWRSQCRQGRKGKDPDGKDFQNLAICTKAFWPPKSPETTPNPKFSRKSGVAPKSPRNSHSIHTKRHTRPHWIPLNSPEFSRNFLNFPEFAQIPRNPWNFRKIRGGEEFTQSATKNLQKGTKMSRRNSPLMSWDDASGDCAEDRRILVSPYPLKRCKTRGFGHSAS